MAGMERFCFIVEWYDPMAALMRKYQLFYYAPDSSIEMFDVKNHRPFLKRTKVESLKLQHMFIGSTINVLSRQLHFVDFGDEYTRSQLGSSTERTLGLIKPEAMHKFGEIISLIGQAGFNVVNMKMCHLSRRDASEFFKEYSAEEFFNALTNYMCSAPIIAMEIMGNHATSKFREFLGPDDPAQARSVAPLSLRARFGTDKFHNAVHASDSLELAAKELEFFFPTNGASLSNTAKYNDSSCCLIKPHIVRQGKAGLIVERIIESGFEISAIQMFNLEKVNAEEFFEVYRGVVQEYTQMVDELSSGPCLALECRAKDAAIALRELAGPADPEIARHLRPRTLRALFGESKIKNAVHCTDLPEDAQLEVEYFFKILDK